ncbi:MULTISPECIES: 50S ribosomal protein L11 methyltransferase [unclassified Mesorhizobium]|uniref:50S ribosomal protein L11 methyltransferase n=1 Tax=unclassified Mesorhizobium TaxID=325217 RepID=UPI000BAEA579|nr:MULTISPECIES: 50S ribosomal protein L11 methyltransferase [unclassified Mesorhizobium]PBB40742.1 50S ribosomal protein L11 methyltransferase [Mesorhizobium sp. WSM3866]RUV98575.1 50S ribosomal protein L11 methyltransferase [Mesorhizobium sp. M1A.F.Ca.IN.020.04.1.1]RUW10005.1 50S ribosomal protein L11 methyltransferase [Mesorhizobium sp. M1A.F.Ca.IN.020.03.1.1]RWF67642.1 MAG: 50S ribosomal protein L11 methyltransferase [Mesorhizobium sp.]RWG14006.1 MAG: 50S ribosomal protein L11 methyltransf
MGQTRFHFTAGKAEADRIFAALDAAFEDEGLPLALLEVDEANDIHEVSLYADGDVDAVAVRINGILADLALPKQVEREALPDIDWVARSLEGLKPVRAGRFFVHGAHDRDKRRSGDLAIEIEAGLAFGTGHHGTTAGCLELLEQVVLRERPGNALDLGTGSAVLAIALAKLAHIPVLATDIDPVAVRVAATNARLNRVKALVETVTAPGFHHPIFSRRAPFDLIVANILARPLMRLAPEMARHIKLGGSLVLSGILDRQRDAVISAYVGQSFRHVRTLHREGWVTIHLKR